jgi:kynureninase
MSVAAAPHHSLARYRDEFPIFQRATYLNSCSLGALSRRSRALVNECLDLWEERGAAAWYDVWLARLDELRERYGRVVGAPGSAISLHASLTGALTAVAEALSYGRRRKVVTTSLDFPTLAYQWLAKATQGVEVEIIESSDATRVPLECFERAVDDRTALVATSHVFFTSGAIQDIRAIAALAHAKGALLLVDGYQAAGQIPVEVKALEVDFYCAGGLKWLLGGAGIAFLYSRPELIATLSPSTAGWFAHADPFTFDPRRLALRSDARRLEGGTPALLPVYAQLGGLEIHEEIGITEIRRVTQALTEDLLAHATAMGLEPRCAPSADERSAIVMIPRVDPHRDVQRLAQAGIVTDARPGHVRLSPFFYNLPDDHQSALEHLIRD